MVEVFITDQECLERFPRREEFLTKDEKPVYLMDPRLIEYLRERGFDLNRPVKSRRSDELGGPYFIQEDAVILYGAKAVVSW